MLSTLLATTCEGMEAKLGANVTVFDADPRQPPLISVGDYLKHWLLHSECSMECASIAVAYVLRCGIPVHLLNQHRLFLGALIVAVKWRDDIYFSNDFYAGVGGVAVPELNRLESEMLQRCEWATHVDGEEYASICRALSAGGAEMRSIAAQLRSGGSPRGAADCSSGEEQKDTVAAQEDNEDDDQTWRCPRLGLCTKLLGLILTKTGEALFGKDPVLAELGPAAP